MSKVQISEEYILRECMSNPYCGETYFDFLEPEEKEMIYKAMRIYYLEQSKLDLIKLQENINKLN